MPPGGANRSANACDDCRRRKVKCSGTQPCTTCVRQDIACIFGASKRRRFSEAYVQKLLDTIRRHEEEAEASKASGSKSLGKTILPTASLSSSAPNELNRPTVSSNQPHQDEVLVDIPTAEWQSGPAFELGVRSILRDHSDSQRHEIPRHQPTASDYTSRGDAAHTSSDQCSLSDLIRTSPPSTLLSKNESFRLFGVFMNTMGTTQHFLDPREFSDSLDMLYKGDGYHRLQTNFWFTQYLLVMATGMLIGSPSEDGTNAPPGTSLLAEAMRRLPPLHDLSTYGLMGVEVLCLVGLVLQWCDRKHEAYLHIGTAARLAMSLGYSLPHDEQEGLSSAVCHKNRVWWTLYMLDRRISAGLGLHMGVDDRQIRAEFPKHSAGFHPPEPMIINIKFARAIGEIMTSIYGQTGISRVELVQRMEKTLKSLYETAESIPAHLTIDFAEPHPLIARTSASLYLMLFQGVMLCLRPMVLQCVKEKVQASKELRDPVTASPVITQLCMSCKEAARRTIRILSHLKDEKEITMFGYYDLDSTFSAAFIIAMSGFVEMCDNQNPPEGLSQATEILLYLKKIGNHAAGRALNELRQLCNQIWCPQTLDDDWAWLYEGSEATMGPNSEAEAATSSTRSGQACKEMCSWDKSEADQPSAVGAENTLDLEPVYLGLDNLDSFGADLSSSEVGNIYSSFNDPSMPLTGIDQADWAEVGKLFDLNGFNV